MGMKRKIDWSLYFVTDGKLARGRAVEDVVAAAVRGGVTVVQLREKELSTREFIESARRLRAALESAGVPLIINDRVDVALAAGAAGVHLGQSDMPCPDARRLVGCDAIIGLSVETLDQAEEAESLNVDYLGVSPIFSTPTKTDTAGEWGIEGLRNLRLCTGRVLVAIGGLNSSNAAGVIEAGADGIAVVSAIAAAPDPEVAARELRRIVEEARTIQGRTMP